MEEELKAVLVSVILDEESDEVVEESIQELKSLVKTAGFSIYPEPIIQRRKQYDSATLIGSGKVQDIKLLVEQESIDLVVFDQSLSPKQNRNIEKEVDCAVIDRTAIILSIFKRHAQTKIAKTQVEIVDLEYQITRLTGRWGHLERQRGSAGGMFNKGMGEKQIEIDRRILRDRITALKKELKTIEKVRSTQRKMREVVFRVALVGYTNVGKTQIMNNITRSEFVSHDDLFVTLDAKTRRMSASFERPILITDTVGFIKKLPHGLVESFKSTLEEVVYADLILHVVDLSHPNYKEQMETTTKVLTEIGINDVPVYIIYNKLDLLDSHQQFLPKMMSRSENPSFAMSAICSEDIQKLKDFILSHFSKKLISFTAFLTHDKSEGLAFINKICKNMKVDMTDKFLVVNGSALDEDLAKLEDMYYKIERRNIS